MKLVFLVLLGLCFGSFINAFVWRIKNKKNWISERSMCPQCKHVLEPIDLVPVISWVFLRGKCRFCKVNISVQYPLVELTCAVLFGLSYAFWPSDLIKTTDYVVFALWLVIVIGSLSLAVYDIKWMLLPNKILYPLTVIGFIMTFLTGVFSGSTFSVLKSTALGVILLFGLFYILFQISGGRWIGGGDVKMGVLLGLIAGGLWPSLLLLFLSSLLATLYTLPFIVTSKLTKTSKIPFGPFLLMAMFVVKLFGSPIINWYAHKILLLN